MIGVSRVSRYGASNFAPVLDYVFDFRAVAMRQDFQATTPIEVRKEAG